MHWVAFAILTYVLCAVQTTLAAFIEIHRVRPDLLILVAVFYAMMARRGDALLACWILGLAADLNGLSFHDRGAVGLHALVYGLCALLTCRLRELVFREHLFTYVVAVVAWTLIVAAAEGAHLAWTLRAGDRFSAHMIFGVYTAAYTAFLAPYAHWLLRRGRGALGLESVRAFRARA
jgi:rod shape-determining protein MreD